MKTKIGYGLYIGHGMALVINSSAVIGNNCNLSQFTTIGSNSFNAANIGDDVYIGPNVCLIENVNVGSQAVIGAGAVVTKDVASGTTVAGVPAQVISNKTSQEFIHNRWDV